MTFPKRVYSFLIIFAFCASAAKAQEKPIGYWRSFLSYSSAVGVAANSNTLFVASAEGFFTYAPLADNMQAYSKVEGMSDMGMQCVAYDAATATTVLVYTNGNIDLFKDNTFYNIPDLKIKTISGLKQVYEVYTENGLAYLSTSFGVLVVDMANHNVKATYQFIDPASAGNQVLGVTSFKGLGNYFYAATTGGLYRADKNNPELQNYQVWQKQDSTHAVTTMAQVDTQMFFSNSKSVFALQHDTLATVFTSATVIRHIDPGFGHLFICENNPGKLRIMNLGYAITDTLNAGGIPMQAAQLGDSSVWIADSVSGIEKKVNFYGVDYFPPGPKNSSSFDLYANNGNLWVMHGGFTDGYFTLHNRSGMANYKDGKWIYYKEYDYQPFTAGPMFDVSVFAKDETNGTVYAGSFLDGLFILNDNGNYSFVGSNSILDPSGAYGADAHDITGLAFDQSGNLWLTQMYAQHQLYVKTPDSQWYKFQLPNTQYGGPIAIDDAGQVWYVSYLAGGVGGGVTVFNYGNVLSDPSDDASYHLGTGVGFGNLPSNTVFCIVKDKNDAMWIGTNNGIAIANNCSAPFNQSPPCDAEIPIVQYDQYAGYLFAGNNVRTIAVDGANRKWVGTDDGVWLLSPDASSIIYRYTVDNSPLPSNHIQKIAIDKVTGEVYIGTDQGLVSYHSAATEGGTTNGDVLVYPNPVPSGYKGTIAIKDLVANADVRITDISGQLVYRTKALGGQAVWNGVDYKGHRPQSGVYLIFVSNADGTQTYTGKLVFLQ